MQKATEKERKQIKITRRKNVTCARSTSLLDNMFAMTRNWSGIRVRASILKTLDVMVIRAAVPMAVTVTPPRRHQSTWKPAPPIFSGVWVNEFKRKLDTGDAENDIIFNDLYHTYEFSIAVFDNCGRGEIPPGHNTYGNGQYLLLRFQQ